MAFASSTNFDHYLKTVWATYVEGQDFKSNDSTIVIKADEIRYVDDPIGTTITHYIETADKRITDYLDL